MNCPKCDYSTRLYDSRYHRETVWRKRECLKCGARFQTREVPLEVYEDIMRSKSAESAQKGDAP